LIFIPYMGQSRNIPYAEQLAAVYQKASGMR
jgi:hypothetical protein